MNACANYAIGQLRLMKGHLATATEGNIRGRLVMDYDGSLTIGSTISVVGKMRYHETNYPIADATTITWFASRANGEWTQVATGPSYTPIAEDAGKKIMLVIHVKGLASEAEVGNVMISQELENSTQLLLKRNALWPMMSPSPPNCLRRPPPRRASAARTRCDARSAAWCW